MQTVALIVITARTNWDKEVSSSVLLIFVEALLKCGGAYGDVVLKVDKAIQRMRRTAADEGVVPVDDGTA